MIWMLPLALVLVLIARVGIWLFPEPAAPPKHYEGDFGDQCMGDPLKVGMHSQPGKKMKSSR